VVPVLQEFPAMPPTKTALIGLIAIGALAIGVGVAGLQLVPHVPQANPRHEATDDVTSHGPPRAASSVPARTLSHMRLTPFSAAMLIQPAAVGSAARLAGRSAASATMPGRIVGVRAYTTLVQRIARRYSIEWKLVMAIIASESGGDPSAVSPAGAVGLMQLMPETATDLGVDPWDPEQNVDGAVRYLSMLLSTFGSVDLTLIAYNAGPGFAQRYREGAVELGAETREFLIRVGRFVEPSILLPGTHGGGAGLEPSASSGGR
jgi:hypothetical protein